MNAASDAILDASVGWAVLAAFSVLWVVLGWFWGRNSDKLDEYVLAGRRVGLALGTATAMATWVTSNTPMAAPQSSQPVARPRPASTRPVIARTVASTTSMSICTQV